MGTGNGEMPDRLYIARDFQICATDNGLVEVKVESKTYLLSPKLAKATSLRIAHTVMRLDEEHGITIHLDDERFRLLNPREAVTHSYQMYIAAKKATAKGGMRH